MKRVIFLTVGCLGLIALEGCKEKTPNRDYIPVIKQRVFLLQQAIKERSKVALDSLLTEEFASISGADSVVQFSYGADPDFQFDRFGRTEIFYTDARARVDGNIVGVDGRILKGDDPDLRAPGGSVVAEKDRPDVRKPGFGRHAKVIQQPSACHKLKKRLLVRALFYLPICPDHR